MARITIKSCLTTGIFHINCEFREILLPKCFSLCTIDKKMDFPKYNGNIHPDEWINDFQNYLKYFKIKEALYVSDHVIALSLVDSTISLPTRINSIEKLRNALKEEISFTIFKNTNKR